MNEEKLIRLAQRGDLKAYRIIYERYEQPLLRTAWRMLGQQQDAEDAVIYTLLSYIHCLALATY
jgi:DNA-directed RNA polymerase specialized sigma24 family protein